jgi:ERCC4-type nuclease
MILIDCHEPKQIIEKLHPIKNLQVARLKYCDYTFSDVAIERKTLSDFFSSIKSGRLQYQMESIGRYYLDKYLIIEGFFDFSYVKNIRYLYHKLFEITADFDVKIIFSCDINSTADAIKRLYIKRNLDYIKYIKRDKSYHAAKFLGVSGKKFQILMSKFGSIKNIALADKKEFKGIKSIGKATIKNVRYSLKEFNGN